MSDDSDVELICEKQWFYKETLDGEIHANTNDDNNHWNNGFEYIDGIILQVEFLPTESDDAALHTRPLSVSNVTGETQQLDTNEHNIENVIVDHERKIESSGPTLPSQIPLCGSCGMSFASLLELISHSQQCDTFSALLSSNSTIMENHYYYTNSEQQWSSPYQQEHLLETLQPIDLSTNNNRAACPTSSMSQNKGSIWHLKEAQTKEILRQQKLSKSKKQLSCPLCQKKCLNSRGLSMHIKKMHVQFCSHTTALRCNICVQCLPCCSGRCFNRSTTCKYCHCEVLFVDLERHMISLWCSACEARFPCRFAFENHWQTGQCSMTSNCSEVIQTYS